MTFIKSSERSAPQYPGTSLPNPYKLANVPLYKFKIDYKNSKWVIYIYSENGAIRNTDKPEAWLALTEDKRSEFEDEWGNKVTYYKVKYFNTQKDAYDHIKDSFLEGSIEEYVPPKKGLLFRMFDYFFHF